MRRGGRAARPAAFKAALFQRLLRAIPALEPGLLLWDCFDDPDGTSLDLRRIAPLAAPGVEAWNQASGDWEICAGQAILRQAPGEGAESAFVTLDRLDVRLQARLIGGCRSAAAGHDNGVHVRFAGLPETWVVGYNDLAGVFRIVQTSLDREQNPVETILASALTWIDPLAEHVIEVTALGERLTANLDGGLAIYAAGLYTPAYASGFGLRLSNPQGAAACREFKLYRL